MINTRVFHEICETKQQFLGDEVLIWIQTEPCTVILQLPLYDICDRKYFYKFYSIARMLGTYIRINRWGQGKNTTYWLLVNYSCILLGYALMCLNRYNLIKNLTEAR